jgi:glycosidase
MKGSSRRIACARCCASRPPRSARHICWAFSNHDVVRAVSRWSQHGSGPPRAARFARFLMALLLTLPGSTCLYQGESSA